MDKNNIIARILGTDKASPADEIRRARQSLDSRHREIDARLAAIQKSSPINGGPGPERRRLLETGTPEQIISLDHEVERLLAERDQQIPAQREALGKRLEAAEATEAREQLPARLKAVAPALAKYRDAAKAMKDARTALDDAVTGVIVSRRTAGDDSPGLPDSTISEIADVRGLRESEDPSRYSINRARLFQELGGTLPEKADPNYTRTRREVQAEQEFYEETSDGQTTRRPTGYLEKGGALRDRT